MLRALRNGSNICRVDKRSTRGNGKKVENSTNCVLARSSVTASNNFLVASMKILDRGSRGICPTKSSIKLSQMFHSKNP